MWKDSIQRRYKFIHITGASGAGTTTLAKAISQKYGHTHLDTDDFFWEKTDPPFVLKRDTESRQKLLKNAIDSCDTCVISGSLTGWGDIFIPLFQLLIYVHTQTEVRLQRLHERELQRFENRILPGGDMAEEHQKFLLWASQYDNGGLDMRSAQHHAEWLKFIRCPIICLDGSLQVEDNIALLEEV